MNDKTDSKHLYLRRLTAQLREKDIELAKLLEGKMKVMKEMVEVVNKNPKNIDELALGNAEDLNLKNLDDSNRDPSQSCQTQEMNLPNPEYLNLVREQKDKNNYTKEQLLSAVQVCRISPALMNHNHKRMHIEFLIITIILIKLLGG